MSFRSRFKIPHICLITIFVDEIKLNYLCALGYRRVKICLHFQRLRFIEFNPGAVGSLRNLSRYVKYRDSFYLL